MLGIRSTPDCADNQNRLEHVMQLRTEEDRRSPSIPELMR
jgi:hypothetical protein